MSLRSTTAHTHDAKRSCTGNQICQPKSSVNPAPTVKVDTKVFQDRLPPGTLWRPTYSCQTTLRRGADLCQVLFKATTNTFMVDCVQRQLLLLQPLINSALLKTALSLFNLICSLSPIINRDRDVAQSVEVVGRGRRGSDGKASPSKIGEEAKKKDCDEPGYVIPFHHKRVVTARWIKYHCAIRWWVTSISGVVSEVVDA
ncbi:hypothetical protein CEXT_722921 [Caerostris extrusa]|uniref:Uncharacterized protein n=1 Tax=Caerostris extrusa TaxID=172846 RepID=A0AAV4WX10_CAEEX|nr:hypothetical protein CEXT_722921 [Caerostris extrusa]